MTAHRSGVTGGRRARHERRASVIPAYAGIHFLGITHVPHRDRTAGQPMTAFGKFREEKGHLFVVVGLQVNHMYVDGVDIADRYEGAQASFTEAF